METPTTETPTRAAPAVYGQAPAVYGQAPAVYGQEPTDQPSFRPSALSTVWQGRVLVLAVTLLALGGGYLYLSQATQVFESTSRIYVEKNGPTIMSQNEGMVMTQSLNYLHTQVGLFTSLPILSRAVEKLDVGQMKTFAGIDNPAMYLKVACLDVAVGKQDEIISVSARSPYPEEAAQIVNAVVESYIDYHGKTKQTTAEKVREILQAEKEKRDKALTGQLEAVVKFKKASGSLLLEFENQNLSMRRVSALWTALSAAKMEVVDARGVLEALKKSPAGSSFQGTLVPPEARAEIAAAAAEHKAAKRQFANSLSEARDSLVQLQSDYSAETPIVVAMRARIERLQSQAMDIENGWNESQKQRRSEAHAAALVAAGQRVAAAVSKESVLTKAVEENSKVASEAMVKQAEYAVLESSVKRAETLVDILDDRLREISVTENTGALNITILDVARPDMEPVEPQPTKTMAITLALGLLFGSGIVLLRDWLDHRLRSSDEMSFAIGAPVLGVLPSITTPASVSELGQLVHAKPGSFTAEACRTVRTAVYFNAENKDAKTLLVTSPESGDGKSSVTSNLAIAMAQVGQRILVIDCDLRRPTQHKIFEIDTAPTRGVGLADVLAGTAEVDSLVAPSGIEGLDVIPCFTRVTDPAEVLNQPEFVELLDKLSERYDRILLDSPPVVAVADARILGAVCDATIVVLRAEKSRGKVTELTRSALESVGASIMGIVVNDVPEGKGAHGEYAYYGVSRGYGYGRYYGYGRKRGYGYGYGYGYGADGDGEDDNGSDAPHRKVDEASQRGGDPSDSRAVDRDLR